METSQKDILSNVPKSIIVDCILNFKNNKKLVEDIEATFKNQTFITKVIKDFKDRPFNINYLIKISESVLEPFAIDYDSDHMESHCDKSMSMKKSIIKEVYSEGNEGVLCVLKYTNYTDNKSNINKLKNIFKNLYPLYKCNVDIDESEDTAYINFTNQSNEVRFKVLSN